LQSTRAHVCLATLKIGGAGMIDAWGGGGAQSCQFKKSWLLWCRL